MFLYKYCIVIKMLTMLFLLLCVLTIELVWVCMLHHHLLNGTVALVSRYPPFAQQYSNVIPPCAYIPLCDITMCDNYPYVTSCAIHTHHHV